MYSWKSTKMDERQVVKSWDMKWVHGEVAFWLRIGKFVAIFECVQGKLMDVLVQTDKILNKETVELRVDLTWHGLKQ